MFDRLFSWLSPRKAKPSVVNREVSDLPFSSNSSNSSNFFVYTRNGKKIYEERDGKVVTGTASDKAEAEKFFTEAKASANQTINDMQSNINTMFDDMKKMFD